MRKSGYNVIMFTAVLCSMLLALLSCLALILVARVVTKVRGER